MLTMHGVSGERNAAVCGLFVQVSLCGTGIAYIITSAISMRYMDRGSSFSMHGELLSLLLLCTGLVLQL